MNMTVKFSRILLMFFLLALPIKMSSQNVDVSAKLDSTTIFIGGQVGLQLKATFPQSANILFPEIADTITSDVEVVEVGKLDTLSVSNGLISLSRDYIVTSFDSGLHFIPPIEFSEVLPDTSVVYKTESMALVVVNPFQNIEVDQQSGVAKICDIKEPIDTPFIFAELLQYWPWLVAAVILLGIVALCIVLYLRHKGKTVFAKAPKKQDPCDVVALRQLNDVKEQKLCQRNMVKEYYSEISDIMRRYVGDRFAVSAMESTTDQLIDALKTSGFNDKEQLSHLEKLLSQSDFVKFARYEPLPDENDYAMIQAVLFVNQTKREEIKSIDEQIKDIETTENLNESKPIEQ